MGLFLGCGWVSRRRFGAVVMFLALAFAALFSVGLGAPAPAAASCGPFTFTPVSDATTGMGVLPDGTVGKPYGPVTIQVSGNTPPSDDTGPPADDFYNWSTNPSLPPGLHSHTTGALQDTMVIDGTPTAPGGSYRPGWSVDVPDLGCFTSTLYWDITTGTSPQNNSLPAVQGDPTVGHQASCNEGQWQTPSGAPLQPFGYAWFREDTMIATGKSYTLTDADGTHVLRCHVTATNRFGSTVAVSPGVNVPGRQADLATTVTAVDAQVPDGAQTTFKVTVTNNGPDPASNVAVTNPLPAGANAISAYCLGGPLACSSDATGATATISGLAAGQSASFVVTLTTSAVGSLTDAAHASSQTSDPNSSNNDAQASTNVTCPVSGPAPGPLPAGCRYDLEVRITAPSAISDVANANLSGFPQVEWVVWMYVKNNGPAVSVPSVIHVDAVWISLRSEPVFVRPPVVPVTTNVGDCRPHLTDPFPDHAICDINPLKPGEEARIKVTMDSYPDSIKRLAQNHRDLALTVDAYLSGSGCDSNAEVTCVNNNVKIDVPATDDQVNLGSAKSGPGGRANVTVIAPGPGRLNVTATANVAGHHAGDFARSGQAAAAKARVLLVAKVTKRVKKAGPITITLAPSAAARSLLRKRGKLKVLLTITFTSARGVASTKTATLTLKR